jgi:hypothetical protein
MQQVTMMAGPPTTLFLSTRAVRSMTLPALFTGGFCRSCAVPIRS